jgi:hypothetical protein
MIPQFPLQVYRILLENKRTQQAAVTTLISYLKNTDKINMISCSYDKERRVWEQQSTAVEGSNREYFVGEVFSLIEEHLEACIYSDKDFLVGKSSYKNYSGLEVPVNNDLKGDQQGYFPLYELLDLTIDSRRLSLLSSLMGLASSLPGRLCQKIVQGIREGKFSDEFYENLKGLSND